MDGVAYYALVSLARGAPTPVLAGCLIREDSRVGWTARTHQDASTGPYDAAYEGYTLHANVSFIASDRQGLEHLCRYVLRPPATVGRVERLEDGTVRMGMKRTWSDGTSAIELSPTELVEKVAAIVPPPRAHTFVYAGGLAGNASWRGEVAPKVATSEQATRAARPARKRTRSATVGSDRPGWSSRPG